MLGLRLVGLVRRSKHPVWASKVLFFMMMIVSCHVNTITKQQLTQATNWSRVQSREYCQVGVEIVHFSEPLHDLDEFHQVSLSLLQLK